MLAVLVLNVLSLLPPTSLLLRTINIRSVVADLFSASANKDSLSTETKTDEQPDEGAWRMWSESVLGVLLHE